MARDDYSFNINFRHGTPDRPATLNLLFTFTALSGSLGIGVGNTVGTDTLPENWIIQWENFVDTGTGAPINMARRLDTKLAGKPSSAPGVDDGQGLFRLHALDGNPEQPADAARLAVRNLLRGYRLRLPTGQAVARYLGLPVLAAADVEAAADGPAQVAALQDGGFSDRTPLWFYILAEASALGGGNRLGPLGSTLVAEVLVGLVRRTPGSILRLPGWRPSLPGLVPGTFDLADLLRFAGVLAGGPPPPRTYVVQPGDTLSSIAQDQLGDANCWPAIFLLNRGLIRNPDLIFPGQVLTLPTSAAAGTDSSPSPTDSTTAGANSSACSATPRLYVVQRGDTLSSIAQHLLGDAGRWPALFALNRAVLDSPDLILPGQVLVLPT
jgi:nucleoid-associated protein YgaU